MPPYFKRLLGHSAVFSEACERNIDRGFRYPLMSYSMNVKHIPAVWNFSVRIYLQGHVNVCMYLPVTTRCIESLAFDPNKMNSLSNVFFVRALFCLDRHKKTSVWRKSNISSRLVCIMKICRKLYDIFRLTDTLD